MAISKVDTFDLGDFTAISGTPSISEDEIQMTQGDSAASPAYQLKNTGGRFKARVSLNTLSGLVVSVQGRLGPGDEFHLITSSVSAGRLSVTPENVMPEMRIVMTKTTSGAVTYVQTGAVCLGEV